MNTMTGADAAMAVSASAEALPLYRVWTPERTDMLAALLAGTRTYPQIAQEMGITLRSVSQRCVRLRAAGDPRFVAIARERAANPPKGSVSPCARRCPDDFAELAAVMDNESLKKLYRCGYKALRRWRAEKQVPNSTSIGPKRLPAPPDFARLAAEMTLTAASAHFSRNRETVKRWYDEASIQPLVVRAGRFRPSGPKIEFVYRDQRDMSHVEQAADFLRHYGQLYRCNPNGTANKVGSHWNRNGYILTDDDIVGRAERLGWSPDDWRKIAA